MVPIESVPYILFPISPLLFFYLYQIFGFLNHYKIAQRLLFYQYTAFYLRNYEDENEPHEHYPRLNPFKTAINNYFYTTFTIAIPSAVDFYLQNYINWWVLGEIIILILFLLIAVCLKDVNIKTRNHIVIGNCLMSATIYFSLHAYQINWSTFSIKPFLPWDFATSISIINLFFWLIVYTVWNSLILFYGLES